MNDPDPYRSPQSPVGIPEQPRFRHWMPLDVLLAAFLGLFSIWMLTRAQSGFLVISYALALFYFATGFCVLRGYRCARYLLLLNSVLVLAGPAYFIYLGGTMSLFPAIYYLGFALASFGYGWMRYRNQRKVYVVTREIVYFGLALLVFTALILAIELVLPPRSLGGPIIFN